MEWQPYDSVQEKVYRDEQQLSQIIKDAQVRVAKMRNDPVRMADADFVLRWVHQMDSSVIPAEIHDLAARALGVASLAHGSGDLVSPTQPARVTEGEIDEWQQSLREDMSMLKHDGDSDTAIDNVLAVADEMRERVK